MSEKLTFTNVEVVNFGRGKKEADAVLTASLTGDVIAKMQWAEVPECFTGSDLEGQIDAISLELVPETKNLGKHRIEISTARLKAFKTVRRELEGKRGKGHRMELRFSLASQDPEFCSKIEPYYQTIEKSKLIVSYEKKPKQEELPGTEATGCSSCDDEIPLQPDNPKKHVNGTKCTAKQPALLAGEPTEG